MDNGIIYKALSGFYYVKNSNETVRCRARGRFRHDKMSPLVGDEVRITETGNGEGIIDEIIPRKNCFARPPIANIDKMVIVAANTIPVTEPFLIDRMAAIAAHASVNVVICINKCDIDPGDELYRIYSAAGFRVIRTSAITGAGIDELHTELSGKISVFTGNSGVGKSSILNMLDPSFSVQVGEVSDKLGRGRHTTRHVELFETAKGAVIADTPGFSSFDVDRMELTDAAELQHCFIEFAPFLSDCRYTGCAHVKEAGCAVISALERGDIQSSRYRSYVRLYDQLKDIHEWDKK